MQWLDSRQFISLIQAIACFPHQYNGLLKDAKNQLLIGGSLIGTFFISLDTLHNLPLIQDHYFFSGAKKDVRNDPVLLNALVKVSS
jgi:hypothetical protein